LSVMVTITFCPTMRYSPLTMSCEKRPDCSSATRVAPLSLATFLALASSDAYSQGI
jgi:2-succinyl-5-enolpyruvyl-6-hydroxy-3-cyclohexene-1-carboxylate synthase